LVTEDVEIGFAPPGDTGRHNTPFFANVTAIMAEGMVARTGQEDTLAVVQRTQWCHISFRLKNNYAISN
jgi:hypothetical protein